MEEFKERLVYFFKDHLGLSQNAFEDACGIPRGTVTSIKVKGPSVEVLMKISFTYPSLNLNWLVCGRGRMLIEEERPSPSPAVSIGTIQTVNIGNWGELIELLNNKK